MKISAMRTPWLVFLDLDGTVWDHLDISITSPPYKSVSDNCIVDSNGVRITLIEGSLDFINWVRTHKGLISSCSWNRPDIAMDALITFNMNSIFDFHKISTSPRKDIAMQEVIDVLAKRGNKIDQRNLFYLDDRDIHMKEIRSRFPDLTFFHMWKEIQSFDEVKEIILKRVNDSK